MKKIVRSETTRAGRLLVFSEVERFEMEEEEKKHLTTGGTRATVEFRHSRYRITPGWIVIGVEKISIHFHSLHPLSERN